MYVVRLGAFLMSTYMRVCIKSTSSGERNGLFVASAWEVGASDFSPKMTTPDEATLWPPLCGDKLKIFLYFFLPHQVGSADDVGATFAAHRLQRRSRMSRAGIALRPAENVALHPFARRSNRRIGETRTKSQFENH